MAEAHWPVGEGDAQAAKLAEWDTSARRTEEINGFLADPQLNDANCFEIYKTKPHKRLIGGKQGDADEDEEQDEDEAEDDACDEEESGSSAGGPTSQAQPKQRPRRRSAGSAGLGGRGGQRWSWSGSRRSGSRGGRDAATRYLMSTATWRWDGHRRRPCPSCSSVDAAPCNDDQPYAAPTATTPPPPFQPDQPQPQRRIRQPSPTTAMLDEPLPDVPAAPPPPLVISQGELQARVAAATAEAQL